MKSTARKVTRSVLAEVPQYGDGRSAFTASSSILILVATVLLATVLATMAANDGSSMTETATRSEADAGGSEGQSGDARSETSGVGDASIDDSDLAEKALIIDLGGDNDADDVGSAVTNTTTQAATKDDTDEEVTPDSTVSPLPEDTKTTEPPSPGLSSSSPSSTASVAAWPTGAAGGALVIQSTSSTRAVSNEPPKSSSSSTIDVSTTTASTVRVNTAPPTSASSTTSVTSDSSTTRPPIRVTTTPTTGPTTSPTTMATTTPTTRSTTPATTAPTTTTTQPPGTATTTTTRPGTTGSTTPPTTTPNGGSLVWEDHFNSLDTSRWAPEHSTYGDGNNELQCYQPNNVAVSQGRLIITARSESVTCPRDRSRSVSSGMVRSSGLTFSPGQAIEFRVKLTPDNPQDQGGLWPAVWSSSWAEGSWPQGGELDFLEVMTAEDPKRAVYSMHYADRSGSHELQNKAVSMDSYFSDSWHVVRFEYGHNGKLRWYLDGRQVFAVDHAETVQGYPAPFDQTIHQIKINLAVGGSPGPLAPGALGSGGATFEVDYIKVFQL